MGFYLRDNPCKDCADREVGCHSTCQSYKEWKESYLDFKREEAKERITHAAIKSCREDSKGKKHTNNFRNKSKLYRIVHDNKIGD